MTEFERSRTSIIQKGKPVPTHENSALSIALLPIFTQQSLIHETIRIKSGAWEYSSLNCIVSLKVSIWFHFLPHYFCLQDLPHNKYFRSHFQLAIQSSGITHDRS